MQTSNLWVTSNERVMLQLSPDKPAFEIGWFTDRRSIFHCQRRPNHIFKNPPSLGFNYQLLHQYDIERIVVHLLPEGKELLTTPLRIREKGKIRKGWGKGYELQYILPISEFGMAKARETEARIDELTNKLFLLCKSEGISAEIGRFPTSDSLKKEIESIENAIAMREGE